jgi:hypothetical protein
MRTWIVVAVLVVGCSGKKKSQPANGGSAGSASSERVAVPTPADAAAPPTDAPSPADAGVDALALSDPKTLDYEHILTWEAIGGLKLGMDEAKVVKLLGKPAKNSFPEEEAASGEFVANWEWPSKGIVLGMGSDKRTGPFKLRTIDITAPSTFATTRGVTIGMAAAELPARYQHNVDEGRDDPNQYLVGSVYGGMLFTLKDDKVAEIFLGAMAE